MQQALDRRGYYRSPVTFGAYREGKPSPNKGRKFPPEPLKSREVLALIDACGRHAAGRRNRALIALLWRTGLRCAEALSLYTKDVDLAAGRVHVLHGKGDHSRTVGIDPMAAAIVNEWIAERRRLGIGPRAPLFCVISKPTVGAPMHAVYLRNLLKELALKAGLDPGRRVHPHALRHTHAFELLEEGFRLDYIQRQLGHASISVTARYIAHLNPLEVVEAIHDRPWPDRDPAGGSPAAPPRAPRLDELAAAAVSDELASRCAAPPPAAA